MNEPTRSSPIVLCILDGWGCGPDTPDNAIRAARTPVWQRLMASATHTQLDTSGEAVGLPRGQMGNSEVGHLTIGAGRIMMQDLPRIDRAVADGSLAANPTLASLIDGVKRGTGRCQLMGLMSPGGVHSHQDHVAALANILAEHGIEVMVHAILDGRDVPPSSAEEFIQAFSAAAPKAEIVTVIGRYFAMDRDNRWERVELAYDAMVTGRGHAASTALDALRQAYDKGQTDEFVEPAVVAGYDGMCDGDGLIMANFRADRARQVLDALLDPDFDDFKRSRRIAFSAAAGMVSYSNALDPLLPSLFAPQQVTNSFGSVIADAGLRQLRIAETEKYAHVTYFFNGGDEHVFEGEDRILVPSPKVATYDLKPEMSATEVTDKLVAAIRTRSFDVVICNFANPDMVGHTGVLAAAIKAVEVVDTCLGRLADAVSDAGGLLLITADHGNIEAMRDPQTGKAHTAHTTNPVPLLLVGAKPGIELERGRLCDIAPTLLDLLHLEQPSEMTGHTLIAARQRRAGD
ncbi:MAG: 2,3-bisphosphoglycerate-independent phosphoglycerate mutase [Pseudomonadota bacterium]